MNIYDKKTDILVKMQEFCRENNLTICGFKLVGNEGGVSTTYEFIFQGEHFRK